MKEGDQVITEEQTPVSSPNKLKEEASQRGSASRSSSQIRYIHQIGLDEGNSRTISRRTSTIDLLSGNQKSPSSTLQVPKRLTRPRLQSSATTALSLTDIQTQSYGDGSRETYANSTKSTPSGRSFPIDSPSGNSKSYNGSEIDDSASLRSFVPTVGNGADVESLIGDVIITDPKSPAWKLLNVHGEEEDPLNLIPFDSEEPSADFNREFDEIGELDAEGSNEGNNHIPSYRYAHSTAN